MSEEQEAVNVLVEAKTIYTQQLCETLYTVMYQGLLSLWNESKETAHSEMAKASEAGISIERVLVPLLFTQQLSGAAGLFGSGGGGVPRDVRHHRGHQHPQGGQPRRLPGPGARAGAVGGGDG